ncbi:membrane protein, partial [Actinotalea fermentans ATCC 43279 = JCM 9966 = DSM 3133]
MTGADVVLTLDLLGTVTFALNGAMTASRRVRLDIVGVLSLGVITAIGGGLIRDVLLGATPPAAFQHWYYLAAAFAGAAAAWVIARPPRGLHRAIVVLDAIGLSVFCVTGAHKAVELGLQPAPAILLGAITAVGGGTIRDVLVGDVPSVLTSELYAIPALAGAAVAVLAGGSAAAAAP